MKCFEDKLVELKMIYRGTEHEFTRQSWGDLCYNKGPTLSVIKAENERIFGGYTSQSWTEPNESYNYTEDDKAWIFSLDCESLLKVKQKNKQKAICNHR
jgi:BTB/POZ domain-containing protein KCTD9